MSACRWCGHHANDHASAGPNGSTGCASGDGCSCRNSYEYVIANSPAMPLRDPVTLGGELFEPDLAAWKEFTTPTTGVVPALEQQLTASRAECQRLRTALREIAESDSYEGCPAMVARIQRIALTALGEP